MIYLIDDKKLRQEQDYNWTNDQFNLYREFIKPVHTLIELQEINKEIFQEGNIILYHESFIDKENIRAEAAERRRALENFTKQKNSYLVIFSGSINTREVKNNVANIPVSILYWNLKIFIRKYIDGDLDLKYLLFGQNYTIEKELLNKLKLEIFKTTEEVEVKTDKKNLFVRPDEDYINRPLSNCEEITIYDNVKDSDFNETILKNLFSEVYDNIFIPLCFGNSLSDYNGLRLACLIRSTKSNNQTSRIFIYGIVGIEYLLQNEYFNILKIKSTYLIPFSKKSIGEAIQKPLNELNLSELPYEVSKLKLDVPKNYEDNHSIANEWAIYRWANTVNTEDDSIAKITKKIGSNLYFKYLQTICPIAPNQKLTDDDLKIRSKDDLKILYIDDEADKGWSEVFCKILYDVNKINFEYIGDDFKNLDEEQIIEISLNKVIEFDADIVILDFRLHSSDFDQKDMQSISGFKILKKIKTINPGIQVILFSATNKIQNLKTFQDAGSDGFILKEAPENSTILGFTKNNIILMLSTLQERIESCFIKSFYKRFDLLEKELLPRKNFKKSINPLPKEFVDEALKWYKLSIDHLTGKLNDSKKAASFLFLFSVLENLSTRIIDVDTPIDLNIKKDGRKLYQFAFRSTDERLWNYIEDTENVGFYKRTDYRLECNRSIPWNLKILNTLGFIMEDQIDEKTLSKIIKKRNDFIHSNSTTGDKFEISNHDIIWLNEKIFNGLIKVI